VSIENTGSGLRNRKGLAGNSPGTHYAGRVTDDDLTPPAKRNVKALTAFLADLEPDDAVVATLATERYGIFAVRGHVTHSAVMGAFALGGHPLDSNKKPQKALQLLRTFHSAERSEADEGPQDPARDVGELGHGDLVRVTISEPAYGVFDISGVAVHSSVDDSILVGSWIVSTAGVAAERVRSVEVLERAGEHELGVPREITTWGAEVLADI
jgi:hypothetical protein